MSGWPVALTIAGSDPSGGAGIQADLKTFHQHGVYGTSVITLLTVQNTQTVESVQRLDPDFVIAQLDALLRDIAPHAAKTGALGDAALVEAIAQRACSFDFPLVVDPVMISKHGVKLLQDDAVEALSKHLLPKATLITPNIPEAEMLAKIEIVDRASMKEAARAMAGQGCPHVLVKGGHAFEGQEISAQAVDLLWSDGQIYEFACERIATVHTHGTGCVFSAAITAWLAKGTPLRDAVSRSKKFISQAIRTRPGLGGGCGPTNMHTEVQ